MSVNLFLADPWKKSHRLYEDSTFNIRPAPEFSTAEVAVASLYRACGFPGYAENEVPKAGRELDKKSLSLKVSNSDSTIDPYTWRTILHGVLESPKQPNQSSKRFLSLSPLVPDVTLYSGSARLSGNSWNPGALLQRMIRIGSPTDAEAEEVWDKLYGALSVTDNDDIWARWLQGEFERRRERGQQWKKSDLEKFICLPEAEKSVLRYPAKQFVKDLEAVIQAKSSMTRRQWTSLLEGIVRLGTVSHVLWLCRVNDRLWRVLSSILGQGEARIPENEEMLRTDITMAERRTFSYGNAAVPTIRDYASRYLLARLGINLVLWALEERKVFVKSLNSSRDLLELVRIVRVNAEALKAMGLVQSLLSLQDEEAKTISCKKGIGANLVEFSRHTLGQRQTTNDALRGYDQSYFLRKKGEARNAPWILSMGPVAVLALVHCCLKEVNGPRSVRRLSEHLASYGIEVEIAEVNQSDLGRNLRMLGLVLDSPDAESGMLLVPPFRDSILQEEQ